MSIIAFLVIFVAVFIGVRYFHQKHGSTAQRLERATDIVEALREGKLVVRSEYIDDIPGEIVPYEGSILVASPRVLEIPMQDGEIKRVYVPPKVIWLEEADS